VLGMAPEVWLYTNDVATFRTVQRPTGDGIEVLLFGSEGERAEQVFNTVADAARFREAVEARILKRGFVLTRTPSRDTAAA
jgi:hypothetical protein